MNLNEWVLALKHKMMKLNIQHKMMKLNIQEDWSFRIPEDTLIFIAVHFTLWSVVFSCS